jgi:hypothetical protein
MGYKSYINLRGRSSTYLLVEKVFEQGLIDFKDFSIKIINLYTSCGASKKTDSTSKQILIKHCFEMLDQDQKSEEQSPKKEKKRCV